MEPRPRLAFIDGLRALAAGYVLVYHSVFAALGDGGKADGLLRLVVAPLSFGRYAVDVFIVISGFCLALPVWRGSFRQFLERRALRILPPYYAALALCIVLDLTLLRTPTHTFWDLALPATRTGVVAHALLVHHLFPQTVSAINPVFWSVAVECHIYLLFPALLWLGSKLGRWGMLVAALAAGYGALALLANTGLAIGWNLTMGAMPHYLALFALGMTASKLAPRRQWGWIALGLGVAVLASMKFVSVLPLAVADLLVGTWTFAALISLRGGGLGARILQLKPLVFAGSFSYSLYLIHGPLVQIAWQYGLAPLRLPPAAGLALLLVVGSTLSLFVAYRFFRIFEAPFQKRRGLRFAV
jgi:peptidoglycan/LPS O-acetylase OafA/YrhL